MNRRKAIQQVGLLTAGAILLPYACQDIGVPVYSNLPLLGKKEQELIGYLSHVLLPDDTQSFPAPESRQQFVLTMINDCSDAKQLTAFVGGFEAFQWAVSPKQTLSFDELTVDEQRVFLSNQWEQDTVIRDFLNVIKRYSLLHFETTQAYMTDYLKFEFMPGRYLGKVAV
jgi:hypothetical protein